MSTTTATPATPAEWEEMVMTALSTPEKANEAITSGKMREYFEGYAKAYKTEANKTMKDLAAQVRDEAAAGLMEMFKRNGVSVDGRPDLRPTDLKAQLAGAAYNADAPGAALPQKVWNSTGQQIQDILLKKRGTESKEARARLDQYEQLVNAYSPHTPADGGFLIEEQFRSDIMTRALEGAIVRPQATVVPLPTGKLRWPVNDMTTEYNEVYGGIVFAWLDAGETFPESAGTFAALSLEAHKLGGLASLPNELIRFAPALEQWARTNMPNALRHQEDLAFLSGNGVDKPLGGLNAANPSLITVSKEVGQPSATITWNNVLAMFARLLPDSYATAEWDITPDAIPEIHTMALPVGTGGSAVMFGEGQGPSKLPMSILGIPIRYTRKAPAVLGTKGDVSLADWTQYVIGDAQAITLDSSEHSAFTSDKTQLRILEHVDGQPAMLSALTPANNGPTLSAFVQLETR